MLPSINWDCAAAKRAQKKPQNNRVEGCVPGGFSPRPSHSRSCSMTGVSQEVDTSAVALHGHADTADAKLEWKPERSPGRGVDKAEAVPIKHAPSVNVVACGPASPPSMSSACGCQVGSEHALRRSSPKATLLSHHQVRDSSYSFFRHVDATARVGDESVRKGSCTGSCRDTYGVTASEKLALREVYVSGKPCQRAADDRPTYFRSGALNVSALATSSSGEYVAVGDRFGRVFLLHRIKQQPQQPQLEANGGDGEGSKGERRQCASGTVSRVHRPYAFAVGRQAYTSVIDPLNSVKVTPCVQALCFLPQTGSATYLLMANEKMPKLFKVIEVRESPSPFSAVNHLGEKSVASLTLSPPGGTRMTAMKEVTRYALNHEYNINSLCPVADSAQFYSADDLTVKLWCVEHQDTSIETYTLKSPFEEEVTDTIFGIRCFSHEPFLLFIVTTAGVVRVLDIRQRLKLFQQTPLVFKNTYAHEDTVFTSSLTDCALSPCGRFVVGRDVISTCLWDVRRDSRHDRGVRTPSSSLHDEDEYCVLQRWELYPHLRQEMEQMFHEDVMEQFNVRFLNNHEVCTGGFSRTLYTLDILKDSAFPGDGRRSTTRCSNGQAFQLPQLYGEGGDARLGSLSSLAMEDVRLSDTDDAGALFNNTVTQLSQPLTSMNGDCSLLASSGQAVFQLTYTNLRC
ncbi:protein phosphatase 2A regulatory subunit [Trypanosoma rangeli SC58]|uniref:Protein phosphatase 2A regulatory subunit n=1 Tax=Trypanosoma rangeli SC58 TaxID=429131 RepID=A0A061IX70_TRYRA|nr:protein phosphatase 2A regulatory subunit [Trypanosoma rangeli SC58]